MDIGERIKRLRERRGWSQNELARRAGVSQAGLSALENETKSPSTQTLRMIAQAMSLPISALFGEEKGDISLNDLQFALYQETESLSDEQLKSVIDFARFVASRDKEK